MSSSSSHCAARDADAIHRSLNAEYADRCGASILDPIITIGDVDTVFKAMFDSRPRPGPTLKEAEEDEDEGAEDEAEEDEVPTRTNTQSKTKSALVKEKKKKKKKAPAANTSAAGDDDDDDDYDGVDGGEDAAKTVQVLTAEEEAELLEALTPEEIAKMKQDNAAQKQAVFDAAVAAQTSADATAQEEKDAKKAHAKMQQSLAELLAIVGIIDEEEKRKAKEAAERARLAMEAAAAAAKIALAVAEEKNILAKVARMPGMCNYGFGLVQVTGGVSPSCISSKHSCCL